METQHLDFRDALKLLAEQAGVELKSTGGPGTSKPKRIQYQAINDFAAKFFAEQLAKTKFALDYCESRGLAQEVRDYWEIGFAPGEDSALAMAIKKAGIALQDAAEVYLVVGDQGSGFGDRFKARLMFPIHDERGVIVAFGGRIIADGQPKYINSSDTPMYSKRRVLYGMHRAKDSIAKKDHAVLVEGYLDVIACHRAGVTQAVASLGTAMSEEQAKLLRRWCSRVTVLYDNDAAGQKASARAAEMLEAEGMIVKVALMPPGQDPDSLLKDVGPDAVVRASEGGLTPLEFDVNQLAKMHEISDPTFWQLLAEKLAGSKDNLLVQRLIEEWGPQYPGLRDPVGARQALAKSVREASGRQSSMSANLDVPSVAVVQKSTGTKRPPPPPMRGFEKVIFQAALQEGHRTTAWNAFSDPATFSSERARRVATALGQLNPSPPIGLPCDWLSSIEDSAVQRFLTDLSMKSESDVSAEVLLEAIQRLKRAHEIASIHAEMSSTLDEETLRNLQERYRQLHDQ